MIDKVKKRKHMLSLLSRRQNLHSQTLRAAHSELEREMMHAQEELDRNRDSVHKTECALKHMLGGSEVLDLSHMAGMRDYLLAAEENLQSSHAAFLDVWERYESSLEALNRSELDKRLFDKTAARLKGEVLTFQERETERLNMELWIASQWSGANR